MRFLGGSLAVAVLALAGCGGDGERGSRQRTAADCLRANESVSAVTIVRGDSLRSYTFAGFVPPSPARGFVRIERVVKTRLRSGNRVAVTFFRRVRDAEIVAATANTIARSLRKATRRDGGRARLRPQPLVRRGNVVLAWEQRPTTRDATAVETCLPKTR